jgi:gamma-glutamyl-gamma-aminobutyraldehyde dehydrogenase
MTLDLSTLRTQALIDGRFVDAEGGATFDNLNPATGKLLVKVAACSAGDVDRAVASARRTFESGTWSGLDPRARKTILLRFADLVAAHAAEIAALDSVDAGKPISDCETLDLPDVVNNIRWYAEAIDKIFGKVSPTGKGNLGLIVREPVGVVGVVVPWNFPAGTLSWKIAPALAAGNSIVVKPAELAPLSAIRLGELALAAGVPPGVFNVVPGLGHIAGKAIGLHNDIDAVTFTGSTEVGRHFLRYAADSNLKKITLECGGKSPQIVMADAAGEIERIAENLAAAAFWNMGQNCTCGSRILVHNSIKDRFVNALADAAKAWPLGPPGDPSTRMGPLIEASALQRVITYVEDARKAGGRIVCGGKQALPDTGGWFYEATVVDQVRPDMAIARDEIFGPVVAVLGFDDAQEAAALANDTAYGLAATVFCRDISQAMALARAVRAGTVAVNGYSEGDITTPFGGYKTSGFGGYDKGLEAFDQYMHTKTIWVSL